MTTAISKRFFPIFSGIFIAKMPKITENLEIFCYLALATDYLIIIKYSLLKLGNSRAWGIPTVFLWL